MLVASKKASNLVLAITASSR